MKSRRLSPLDQILAIADQALRTSLSPKPVATRPNPAADVEDTDLTGTERRHAGGLMRVNHAGEIAAQALYHGQAATARLSQTREAMEQAAQEETDHLAWCAERLEQLGHGTSRLAPLWYAGSFTIGALAGLAGDRWSLGFLAETERQVVNHLAGHLEELPEPDARSRAIVAQMKDDEAEHSRMAADAGGAPLPGPVRTLMRMTSRIMTRTAYWI